MLIVSVIRVNHEIDAPHAQRRKIGIRSDAPPRQILRDRNPTDLATSFTSKFTVKSGSPRP